ncbi:hypothetical protein RUM4293_03451 [Ruegeria atlantica]|uniref:Uncharacterized protein n=1 Tax=Ruegeria atlantica TaxID=81569 RepID=A0A0P1E831_9RHOB|nr:hypothetical protein RUM4293_03451 [Ruegeria atlantica]
MGQVRCGTVLCEVFAKAADKETRFQSACGPVEEGKVYLPAEKHPGCRYSNESFSPFLARATTIRSTALPIF